jgi:hypothetical protein
MTYIYEAYADVLAKKKQPVITRTIGRAMSFFSKDFIQLVQERDPRAMAMLAQLLALSAFTEFPWWQKGCAEFEVTGIASIMPDEWKWAMQWPLYIVQAAGKRIHTAAEELS